MFFSCFRCCERDPQKLYKIGMDYKSQFGELPQGDTREAFIRDTKNGFDNYKDYIKRAADKGHSDALYEYGKLCHWSNNFYGYPKEYMEAASRKGHLLAKQWLLDHRKEKLDRDQADLDDLKKRV